MLVFNNWNGKANNAQWFFLKTKKRPNDFLIFHFISLRMLLTREIKTAASDRYLLACSGIQCRKNAIKNSRACEKCLWMLHYYYQQLILANSSLFRLCTLLNTIAQQQTHQKLSFSLAKPLCNKKAQRSGWMKKARKFTTLGKGERKLVGLSSAIYLFVLVVEELGMHT